MYTSGLLMGGQFWQRGNGVRFHNPFRKPKVARSGVEAKARAEARDKNLSVRFLKSLQTENPALYQDIMLRRLGLAADAKDPLQVTLKTLRGLQDAGLIDDPKNVSGHQWVKELAPLLPGLLGAFGQMVPQPQGGQPQVTVSQPTPQPQPAVAAPNGTAQIAAPQPAAPSAISQQLIKILDPMTPTEGATWLLSQKVAFAEWFTEQLCIVPDDQLSLLFADTAARLPDVAGLMNWLTQRPEWVIELAHEVRKARKVPEPTVP